MRFTMRGGSNTLGYGVVTELLDHQDVEKLDAERKVIQKQRQKQKQEQA